MGIAGKPAWRNIEIETILMNLCYGKVYFCSFHPEAEASVIKASVLE